MIQRTDEQRGDTKKQKHEIGVYPFGTAEQKIADCDISALFLGGGKSIIHGVLRVKMPEEQDIGR